LVFASLTFLYLFLPLGLAIYFLAPGIRARNTVLVALSFAFYAWGEPLWVVLLLASATGDYLHGLLIERYRTSRWAPRAILVWSLVFNLGMLGVFKYSAFFATNVNAVLGTTLPVPQIALPIGISFYTFQTISYVVDVYRGHVKAQRSFTAFLMFVSLFPQLVAGPIVRYADVESEMLERRTTLRALSEGAGRFAVGLFKKVCIANVAGELVRTHLDGDLGTLALAEAWFGLLAFTLQIYFDFSGYSDMAIGLGRMLGFHFPENFNHPYVARTATDFWRRWHISLSTFFRDYVYIPLGGNRSWPIRNLFVVWMLTGLWHGASWNFVFWGLYYGVLLYVERLGLRALLERLPRVVSHAYLIVAVMLGWAIFYFEDTSRLVSFASVLFHVAEAPLTTLELHTTLRTHAFWLALALILCTPLPSMARAWASDRLAHLGPRWQSLAAADALLNALFLVASSAMLVGHSYNPFLYFRF
jgi:alginate O-acetyltransferase complex protein AlgI